MSLLAYGKTKSINRFSRTTQLGYTSKIRLYNHTNESIASRFPFKKSLSSSDHFFALKSNFNSQFWFRAIDSVTIWKVILLIIFHKTKISIFVFSIRAVHILIISHLIASTQRTLRKMPELHRTQDNQLKIKGPSFSFRLYVGLESMNIENCNCHLTCTYQCCERLKKKTES